MSALLVTLHVLICVALVIIVLLQAGKGAEVGAVFGGGQAIFGGEGPANFMNKLTSVVAIGFMITSLALALVSAHRGSVSVVEQETVPITEAVTPTSPEDLDAAMEALKEKAGETAPVPAVEAPEAAAPAPPEAAPAE